MRMRDKLPYMTGFQPATLWQTLRLLPKFWRDVQEYERKNSRPSMRFQAKDAWPILTDMWAEGGTANGHYFHQDLWAAKKILEERPEQHVDIGSRIDGFVSHLLLFMPVTVVDIRAVQSKVAGLTFFQDDATDLARFADNSIASLSSLNAAEHFGLGRYSDPIDPEGCFRFMASLQRVLAPGGRLYFSVPAGRERVEFNAMRVFEPETIVKSFPGLELLSFSYVGDDGDLREDLAPSEMPTSEFACGLFEFTKKYD